MIPTIKLCDASDHVIGANFTPNEDVIAFALAHINRFNGHAGSYSVAQHSCYVHDMLPDELKLDGLLHDAPEAFICDIPTPLKAYLGNSYTALEDHYHDVIDSYYGVKTRSGEVRDADLMVLAAESDQLDLGIVVNAPAANIRLVAWPARYAYKQFMERFNLLWRGSK